MIMAIIVHQEPYPARLARPSTLVMETGKVSEGDDGALALNWSTDRRIFGSRHMRLGPIVVLCIRFECHSQLCLAEDNSVIQALSENAADHPFYITVLPK